MGPNYENTSMVHRCVMHILKRGIHKHTKYTRTFISKQIRSLKDQILMGSVIFFGKPKYNRQIK